MPSTREIQAHFGFASQTAAMSHLRALEKKGVIVRLPGKARAVVFPEDLEREEVVDIPIYGSIAAGMAEVVEEEKQGCISIDIASLGIPRNARTFALKVRGESMIDAGIHDGDLLVVDRSVEATDGKVVIVSVNGELTVKRLHRAKGKSWLLPENPDYPPIALNEQDETHLWGVVTNVIHPL